MQAKKLIVIHGIGASLAQAVHLLRGLRTLNVSYDNGKAAFPRRYGLLVRRFLRQPEEDPVFRAFQHLLVARVLAGCLEFRACTPADAVECDERALLTAFSDLGLPVTPRARRDRARQLEAEALAALAPVLPALDELSLRLAPAEDGTEPTEPRARQLAQETLTDSNALPGLLATVEAVRGMGESGGDLDTVASAAFYTHWLHADAQRNGTEARYGRDYRYIFVNYHEGIRHLAEWAPADVLMADFPIGALPDFEQEARFLHDRGVRIERFEDHHPYTVEHRAVLDRLRAEGVVGTVALSGECVDDDSPGPRTPDALLCGADMVHSSTLADTPLDCDGARELRRAAHSEDFVTGRHELGMTLTEIIKGGFCKLELVQLLAEAVADNCIGESLEARGWPAAVREREQAAEDARDALLENAYVLSIRRPGDRAVAGGRALGDGSDAPAPPSIDPGNVESDAPAPADEPHAGQAESDSLNLLVAHAYRAEPGQPAIHVGKAVQLYRSMFADLDYVFYCYGSSLLVARRTNQADLSLNLGVLMGAIGGEGDGGHAGAAVARPSASPDYPAQLLGSVNAGNFRGFVDYLAFRLKETGLDVIGTHDRSVPQTGREASAKRVLLVVAAAFLVGLLLAFFHPRFKPDIIRRSNQDFLPQIDSRVEPAAQPPSPGGG